MTHTQAVAREIPATGEAHSETASHDMSFIRKYIFATDHKIIGLQFFFVCLLFLLLGTFLSMAIRWELAFPGKPFPLVGRFLFPHGLIDPATYNMLVTMHGSVMIFLAIIPLLVGAFGNFLVPLMIGTRDMAFPTLNMISVWMFFLGGLILSASFFVAGGAASAGWTAYPPLSALPGAAPGLAMGQNFWIVGVFAIGVSSIMGSINYLTTIVKLRAPGMTFFRLPLTVWAIFITSIMVLLATPVLGGALLMLFLDRVVGTSFFLISGLILGGLGGTAIAHTGGGQPLLWQHLFWFYSHPAVYIMILPAMGMISDILSTFSRKPIFGYRAMVYSLSAIAGLGFIVWGHHMFQSGMDPKLGTTFMVSTMLIALPSSIKVFNWLGTIWGGNLQFKTPMLNALAFVSMFVIGGFSGLFMAATPVDIYLHDTYYLVAHIHYVLFGGSLFGIFAAIYYWYPKMFGRLMNETWGKIHFFLTFILFNAVFFPMHTLGLAGMPRRTADPMAYKFLQPYHGLVLHISYSAFLLGLVQIIFMINFFYSLFKGREAGRNPWRANTLEWTAPSPPPHGNYETIPVVLHGPYEYSHPQAREDYLPQNQPLP